MTAPSPTLAPPALAGPRRAVRVGYLVLALVVAAEVVIQAVVMVWAISGLGVWVSRGGVLDSSVMESEATAFPEIVGLIVHGVNGTFVVPIIALVLLIISFFTKAKGAIRWAAILFGLVVLQGQLGFLGHEFPISGALHGLNALITFTVALYLATRMRTIIRSATS